MQKKKKMRMKNEFVLSCQFYEEEKPDLQWGQIISVVASTFCATKIDNLSTDQEEPKEIKNDTVSDSDCGYGRELVRKSR